MQDYKYGVQLLSRASFPAALDADGRPCIVEVTVFLLNAVASTSFMLDGFDPFLRFIGLEGTDTYITRHEVEDIVTVVHIIKQTNPANAEPKERKTNYKPGIYCRVDQTHTYDDDLPPNDDQWQWIDGMHLENGELVIKPTRSTTTHPKERENDDTEPDHKG